MGIRLRIGQKVGEWLNWKPVIDDTILRLVGAVTNSSFANYTTSSLAITTSGFGMIKTGGNALFATTLPAKCCYLGASALYATTCTCGIIDAIYCQSALGPVPIVTGSLGLVTSYGAKTLQCVGDSTNLNCYETCTNIVKWLKS
jgi:hypothetical protein